MIRARFRDDLERVRHAPFYPVVPFVPIALMLTNVALLGFVFWKVTKLGKRELAHR
jgi:hypothetical protein